MPRKPFFGGNWKMNGDKASIDVICKFLTQGPKIIRNYLARKVTPTLILT